MAEAYKKTGAAPYAGEVTAQEAWEMLASTPNAQIVDVRTPAEWMFVGSPNLAMLSRRPVQLPWKLYPNFEVNPRFAEQLAEAVPAKDTPLLFLCRAGGRSLDAAIHATAQGYARCYNITDGFEGHVDSQGHRGRICGWKAANLPWEQQ